MIETYTTFPFLKKNNYGSVLEVGVGDWGKGNWEDVLAIFFILSAQGFKEKLERIIT